MTRHGGRRPPPIDDRDLAAEVLYLHSLWRRGPAAPAPVPVPVTAAAPNQFPAGRRRRPRKRKRRPSGRGGVDSEDAGPDSPRAPFPPPSPDASASASPEESTSPPPAPAPAPVPVPAATDPNQSRPGRRRPRRLKRRRSGPGNADSEDAGGDSPHAPSPPASPDAPSSPWPNAHDWPDGPTSSKPPPPPPSPGSLAHREALRAAADFFASHGSDGEEEEDDEVSESEGDEEEAAEFFTGMFERDAELRGHYERGWEEGQFACMACAGRRKARRGRARRFRGCVGLVQHARSATRFGRPAAHRALAAVVCRVLGWDINRLPSIVIDPRGTLSQALAARVQSDAQEAKETVETEIKGSNTDVDKAANELVTSKESAGMNKDVEENGPLNSEGNSKNNEDVVKTGMEEPLSIDGEKVATELDGDKESSEKEDAVKTWMGQPLSIDSEKVATELDGEKESSKKEVNATVSKLEHAKTDGTGDTAVARLGNNPAEENVDQNKEHANSIVKFYEELEGEDLFTS